jgi:hypothetical protein
MPKEEVSPMFSLFRLAELMIQYSTSTREAGSSLSAAGDDEIIFSTLHYHS